MGNKTRSEEFKKIFFLTDLKKKCWLGIESSRL